MTFWWSVVMPHNDRQGRDKQPRVEGSEDSVVVASKEKSGGDDMKEFMKQHKSVVPYVGQSYSWDCGLACAEMALRARGVKKVSFWDLRQTCSTDSVWSIDIAYLLRFYRVEATFYTVTKGVRPEYRKQEFYRRQLPEDTKRVNELFLNADGEGVQVVERPVHLSEIRDAVHKKKHLVLVLLDKRLLRCTMCDDRSIGQARSLFPSRSPPGFLGHYILLYAYDPGSDMFLMKDPAALRETCIIPASVLEEARLAFGTDQDILFIGSLESLERSGNTNRSASGR